MAVRSSASAEVESQHFVILNLKSCLNPTNFTYDHMKIGLLIAHVTVAASLIRAESKVFGMLLTALSLRLYLYSHFTSRDWYSGDAHAARLGGSMFDPLCVRCIFLAFALGSRTNANVAIPA